MFKKIPIHRKIYRKLCRAMSKSPFIPNNLRIVLLKQTGINIGKDVIINEGFTLACDIGYESNLSIEDRVAFGPNVTLVLTSHPNKSKLRDLKDTFPSIEIFGKISIGNDSWIGAGAIVLPNIIIREFTIIGAGAVVTQNFPPGCVIAGVPAKIIKNIDYCEVKKI